MGHFLNAHAFYFERINASSSHKMHTSANLRCINEGKCYDFADKGMRFVSHCVILSYIKMPFFNI